MLKKVLAAFDGTDLLPSKIKYISKVYQNAGLCKLTFFQQVIIKHFKDIDLNERNSVVSTKGDFVESYNISDSDKDFGEKQLHRLFQEENFFIVKVLSRTMMPSITYADFIIFSVCQSVLVNGIYILSYNGLIMIRRIQFISASTINIVPDNPIYSKHIGVDLKSITVYGHLIGKFVRM